MRISIGCPLLLLPALFAGCAYYEIQPIAAKETEAWAKGVPPKSDGYIFYQPELYFSATIATETVRDANGKEQTLENLSVTPLYLPNYQKPYRVTTHNFLSKADFGFEFENGWKLTKLSDKSDNSTLANTLAGGLKTILSAGGVGVAAVTPPRLKKRVILFRPLFDPATGYFEGFREVGVVEPELPAPGR